MTSTTRYSNRRSSTPSTTIALPETTTGATTEADSNAIKKGDRCLIFAQQYIEWNANHKYPDRDFTWMKHIFTVQQVKSTVAIVVASDIRKQVAIACLQRITPEQIEEIRSPSPPKETTWKMPPTSITRLLNLSGGSEIASEADKVTEEDNRAIELCKWLLESPSLPSVPFELHPGVTVMDGYLNALIGECQATIDWAEGKRSKKHPRYACGALIRDLEALKRVEVK